MKKNLLLFVSILFVLSCGNKQTPANGGLNADSLAIAEADSASQLSEQEKELLAEYTKVLKEKGVNYQCSGTVGDKKAKLTLVEFDVMQYYGNLEIGEGSSKESIYLKGFQEVALLYLEGYHSGKKYVFEVVYEDDSNANGTLKIDDEELKVKMSDQATDENPEIAKLLKELKDRCEQEEELVADGMGASTTMVRYASGTDELIAKLEKKKSSMSPAQLEEFKALKRKRSQIG